MAGHQHVGPAHPRPRGRRAGPVARRPARRFEVDLPPRGTGHRPHHASARPAGAASAHRGRRPRRGPARAGRPPGADATCPVARPGPPPVPAAARRPSCASNGPASSRSACARPRAAAAAPTSTSCGSTAPTTTTGASTGRPRPGPAGSIVRTFRAEQQPDAGAPARQRAGHGRPGRRRAPARARHGRDHVHHARWPPGSATSAASSPSTTGSAAVVRRAAGGSQVGRVTEAMFDLEPELVESDYAGAFADDAGPLPAPDDAHHPVGPRRSRPSARRSCPPCPSSCPAATSWSSPP